MNAIDRITESRSICLLGSLMLFAVTLSTQAQQDLILETEPEHTIIPLTGTLKLDDQGRVIATPVDTAACQATSTCEGVDVELSSFSANNEATSLSVDQGKSVAFRWGTRGAWSCETTGDFPGWTAGTTKLPFAIGSQETVDTSSTAEGTYTAGLICMNGSVDSQPRDVSITVNVSDEPLPEPTDCPSDRQPPANWTRVSTCLYDSTADCTDLGAIFGGSGSLADVSTGNIRNLVLNTNSNREYWAMEFNTVGFGSSQTEIFNIEGPQNPIGAYSSGAKAITFSECPGDFNKSAIPKGCYFDAGFLGFITIGSVDVGGPSSTARCQLELDKTYYFNVLYTSSSPGTDPDSLQPSTCSDGNPGCGNQWVIQ